MYKNVVTLRYSEGKMNFATKMTLWLSKLGLIKISDGYLPILTNDDNIEVGGLYAVEGSKMLVNFLAWITDYFVGMECECDLWDVRLLSDGSMTATKL